MMGKEKPYCTIDVPNVETAAYLMALVNPNAASIYRFNAKVFTNLVLKTFQGGADGLRAAHHKIFNNDIWNQLHKVLNGSGSFHSETSAPWRTPQAPTEIDGNPVTCRKAGLQVGCVEVSTEELRLLLEKCEVAEE